ncbi:hypothetical protein [Sphingobacterium bovisgrunnientis]|uniref:hypothetical protein n=1 Tax=Sphingobacterium bovisgrunnientis TaxID=1874697 RepID=UPI001358587F|nr:hypothetical protein [Sphingobacterium bovisgrunnientis]
MGIRFEKDTILNWINEMGKFLRLLVNKWEGQLEDLASEVIPKGYKEFFNKEREELIILSDNELIIFASTLEPEQIRPLAQLFMYDGLLNSDKAILAKAKVVFEYHMKSSGSFSFEDYDLLGQIDKAFK